MRTLLMLIALSSSLTTALAWAEQPVNPRMTANIDGSGQGFQGNLMINQSAGDQQQQANARAISIGDHASTRITVRQTNDSSAPAALDAHASINGAAFSQGNGVLGVNQSAGIANQQINAFRLELNALPESLDDSALAQSAAPATNSGVGVPQGGERVVEMDDQAFAGSRGVVQLNQSAGVGNRSANNLSIRVLE